MIVADSSNNVNWNAMVYFIKQVVGDFDVSPKGTHFALIGFGDRAVNLFTFPTGPQSPSQYNVRVVRQFIDATSSRRPKGTQRNINGALTLTRTLLTNKQFGVRPNSDKVNESF